MKYLCKRSNGEECLVTTEKDYQIGDTIELIVPDIVETKELVNVTKVLETE